MPLHLLGKKSWNVYNTANIERVRRDEAAAEAAEAAQEQRMQELDALRRTAVLRGETPPPIPADEQQDDAGAAAAVAVAPTRPAPSHDAQQRKRQRRLRNEDDTDRDIRLARADYEAGRAAQARLQNTRCPAAAGAAAEVPLTDRRGHIQLFHAPPPGAEEDKARAGRGTDARPNREEAGAGMKFADAAGYKAGGRDPWYTAAAAGRGGAERVRKDAFGNDDAGREKRDERRVVGSDPLAAMRRAQSQLKAVQRERAEREEGRRREMRVLEKEEEEEEKRRQEKDRRRRREREREKRDAGQERDELEGFSLDAGPADGDGKRRSLYQDEGYDKRYRRDEGHYRRRDRHERRSRSPHRPRHEQVYDSLRRS